MLEGFHGFLSEAATVAEVTDGEKTSHFWAPRPPRQFMGWRICCIYYRHISSFRQSRRDRPTTLPSSVAVNEHTFIATAQLVAISGHLIESRQDRH